MLGLTFDVPDGASPSCSARSWRSCSCCGPRASPEGASARLPRWRPRRGGGRAVRVCVVGCGAVGSLFAANLAQLDDVEVWAYDLDGRHVAAINANGLRLTGCGELVGRLRATTDAGELPGLRLRHRGDEEHAHRAGDRGDGHAFADGAVCSVQNGVGNEEAIAGHVERVIRGTTFPAGHVVEPGHVNGTSRATRRSARSSRARRRSRRSSGSPRRAPRGHADGRGRRRAGPAVAEGDLQRRHEPDRGADRPDARARVRGPGAARARLAGSSTRARRSPPHRGSSSTPTRRS